MKYLDKDGVLYFWQKIKTTFIQGVKVNGTKATKDDDGCSVITVPTKTSDITNDSGYITKDQVPEGSVASTVTPIMDGTASLGTDTGWARGDHVHPSDTSKVDMTMYEPFAKNVYAWHTTYDDYISKYQTEWGLPDDSKYHPTETAEAIKTYVANAVAGVTQISFQVVTTLPSTGEVGVIYLVPQTKTSTQNIYDEYIYVNDAFEKLGSTDVDLTGYVKETDLEAISNAEIDEITA